MALSTPLLAAKTIVAEATPVIDVDGTFYIQGGLFLVLMFVLHHFLFKPWLAVQDRHAERIGGAHDKASSLHQEAEALGEQYEDRLAKARETAVGERNDARRESEAKQKTIVDAARSEATQSLDRARERIGVESSTARDALSGRIDELAGEITVKVIGRSI